MTQNLLTKKILNSANHPHRNIFNMIESIKKYIFEHPCQTITMNISHLNIIDASKIATLCSTYHYAKYPHGKISWITNSHEVKELVKPLNLGNTRFINVQ